MSKIPKDRPARRGQLSRRAFLRGSAITLASVAALGGGEAALAQTKVSKQDAGYQDSPRNGQRCDGCRYFSSGSNTCQLVVGNISPQGWCTYYAAGTSAY